MKNTDATVFAMEIVILVPMDLKKFLAIIHIPYAMHAVSRSYWLIREDLQKPATFFRDLCMTENIHFSASKMLNV